MGLSVSLRGSVVEGRFEVRLDEDLESGDPFEPLVEEGDTSASTDTPAPDKSQQSLRVHGEASSIAPRSPSEISPPA